MKTVQELLSSTHAYEDYDWAVSGNSTTCTKQDVANYIFSSGNLSFSKDRIAREVHIYCNKDFEIYINSSGTGKKIPLTAQDSPFIINNMEFTTSNEWRG